MVLCVVLSLSSHACPARPDAALQFAEAVVNLRFDEDPKYSAYLGLFEPLCGPQPQRPILTDSLKVSAPAMLGSGCCAKACNCLQCKVVEDSVADCTGSGGTCKNHAGLLQPSLVWCQGRLCAWPCRVLQQGPCAGYDIAVVCACCGKPMTPPGPGVCRAFPVQACWLHAQHVKSRCMCVLMLLLFVYVCRLARGAHEIRTAGQH